MRSIKASNRIVSELGLAHFFGLGLVQKSRIQKKIFKVGEMSPKRYLELYTHIYNYCTHSNNQQNLTNPHHTKQVLSRLVLYHDTCTSTTLYLTLTLGQFTPIFEFQSDTLPITVVDLHIKHVTFVI